MLFISVLSKDDFANYQKQWIEELNEESFYKFVQWLIGVFSTDFKSPKLFKQTLIFVTEIARNFKEYDKKILYEERIFSEILKIKSPEDDKIWKRDDKVDTLAISLIGDEKQLKDKMESLVWKFLYYQHDETKWQKH